jgi:hypothetical protein
MKRINTFIAILIMLFLISCHEKGASQKTGERLDEVIDNIQHGDAPLKEKGTLEKMGESIDESLDTKEKDKK